MKEYVERQKLFDALPDVKEDKQISLYGAIADFMVIASSIPSADVVEVVRCMDCKCWGIREGNDPNKNYFCNLENLWCKPARKSTDFCSYGERKEQK